jgi:hypothetical protein
MLFQLGPSQVRESLAREADTAMSRIPVPMSELFLRLAAPVRKVGGSAGLADRPPR